METFPGTFFSNNYLHVAVVHGATLSERKYHYYYRQEYTLVIGKA